MYGKGNLIKENFFLYKDCRNLLKENEDLNKGWNNLI